MRRILLLDACDIKLSRNRTCFNRVPSRNPEGNAVRISRHLFGNRSSTMSFRPFVAGVFLLAAAQGTAHAGATLTTNYNTWVANAPSFLSTTDDPNYNGDLLNPATTSSINTTAGGTLTMSPGGDAILKTFADWGPWTAGNSAAYHGIVYDTVGQTETITLPNMFTAFALEIQPDGAGPGGFADVVTI